MAPAAALFWNNHNDRSREDGSRVEAPAILKEFIDGVEFGRGRSPHTHDCRSLGRLLTPIAPDPEGTLFFNDIKDLGGNSYYDAFRICGTVDDETPGVVIQFYANLESTDYYAQV
jgi:hypothetical protein